MRGSLVRIVGGSISINLDKEKFGRVVGLLKDIKFQNARLLPARVDVDKRGGLERLDGLRLDVNMNMDNQHDSVIAEKNCGHKCASYVCGRHCAAASTIAKTGLMEQFSSMRELT
jgi:hypothetical protein